MAEDDSYNPSSLPSRLVLAMLENEGGWTEENLLKSADILSIPPEDALEAFPNACAMVAHLHRLGDNLLRQRLEDENMENLRIRDKVSYGVKTRLTIFASSPEKLPQSRRGIRQALSVLAFPGNQILASKLIAETADIIWKAAGDQSTDFNFYTKRGLLAGVYLSTLFYWLEDNSEGQKDSWGFLNRSIDRVIIVGRNTGRVAERVRAGTSFLSPLYRHFASAAK